MHRYKDEFSISEREGSHFGKWPVGSNVLRMASVRQFCYIFLLFPGSNSLCSSSVSNHILYLRMKKLQSTFVTRPFVHVNTEELLTDVSVRVYYFSNTRCAILDVNVERAD